MHDDNSSPNGGCFSPMAEWEFSVRKKKMRWCREELMSPVHLMLPSEKKDFSEVPAWTTTKVILGCRFKNLCCLSSVYFVFTLLNISHLIAAHVVKKIKKTHLAFKLPPLKEPATSLCHPSHMYSLHSALDIRRHRPPPKMKHISDICCWCSSCPTSGTHMAALKLTCLARFCHPAHPSQTSRSTVRLYLTPQRASIWTSLTPTTFMKSRGPSMRVAVSAEHCITGLWGVTFGLNCIWYDLKLKGWPLIFVSQVRSMKRWRCTCWGKRLGSASASWGETKPCRLWVRTPVTRLVWDGLDLRFNLIQATPHLTCT